MPRENFCLRRENKWFSCHKHLVVSRCSGSGLPHVLNRGPHPRLRVAVEVVGQHQRRVVPFLWWPIELVFHSYSLLRPFSRCCVLSFVIFHTPLPHRGLRSLPAHVFSFLSLLVRSPATCRCLDAARPPPGLLRAVVQLSPTRWRRCKRPECVTCFDAAALPCALAH